MSTDHDRCARCGAMKLAHEPIHLVSLPERSGRLVLFCPRSLYLSPADAQAQPPLLPKGWAFGYIPAQPEAQNEAADAELQKLMEDA